MDRAAINSVRVSSAAADVVPKWFYSTADRKQIGPVSAAGACATPSLCRAKPSLLYFLRWP
jgi:hypothetical protein